MPTMALRATYDRWAETYPPAAHNPLMRAEQAAVSRRLDNIRAMRALDVGTGSGRYMPLLARTGAHTVIGAHLWLGMLRSNHEGHRVCADAYRLPLPAQAFDLVNASLMAGDIRDLPRWLEELARVLTPSGHLLYSDFHPEWDRRGWQRTFRDADDRVWTLPRASHHPHEHLDAMARAGLTLVASDDVTLPMTSRSLFLIRRRRDVPVATVFHARKAVR